MEKLRSLNSAILYENVDLSRYTTIKLGKIGSVLICKSKESLKESIKIILDNEMKYHLVGWGSNQVLLNTKGVIFIKIDFECSPEKFLSTESDFYFPASVPLLKLTSMASKLGLRGWEVFTGIPASLGGAIFMNAGTALGEIGTYIKNVDILKPNGEIYNYICDKNSFSYRKNNFVRSGEVILGAQMRYDSIDSLVGDEIKKYLAYRKKTQPLATKNCGSVFKNFDENWKAGITIDRIGLKGFGTEKIAVSNMHGNFIENKGEASSEDFKELTEKLLQEIERQSGIEFELEVKIY